MRLFFVHHVWMFDIFHDVVPSLEILQNLTPVYHLPSCVARPIRHQKEVMLYSVKCDSYLITS